MGTKIPARAISGFTKINALRTHFKIILLNGRIFPEGNTYLARHHLTDDALEWLDCILELGECSVI